MTGLTVLETIFWERVFAAAIAAGKSAVNAACLADSAINYQRDGYKPDHYR